MSSDQVKVLLVEDNPGDARLIIELLNEAGSGKFHVDHVTRLSEALNFLRILDEESCDVILLDLSLPDSEGFETFTEVYKRASFLPIIILTGLDDKSIAESAVEQGAQDFLNKGKESGESLARSIRYAIQRHRVLFNERLKVQKTSGGKVIGLVGAKGGVGTTTVAINVAAAIAAKKSKVIAVDFRPYMGSLSIQLGIRRPLAENWRGLFELDAEHINERELAKWLRSTNFGVKVFLGPQKVDDYKEVEPSQAEAVIKGISALANFTIVDLPCHPSSATQAVVQLCDLVTLVVEPQLESMMVGKVWLKLLKRWMSKESKITLVAVNRTPLPSQISLDAISSFFECKIAGEVPHASEALIKFQRSGLPIVLSSPASESAINLKEIAKNIVEYSLFSRRQQIPRHLEAAHTSGTNSEQEIMTASLG